MRQNVHFTILGGSNEQSTPAITLYTSIERKLFPMREEEIGELSDKMRDFLRVLEVVHPSRFITKVLYPIVHGYNLYGLIASL